MKQKLIESFLRTFPGEAPRVFFAGGRINLIGEHTDYNGGHVFPCALTMGTWCLLRKRPDDALCFYSLNFQEAGVLKSSLKELVYKKEMGWANYAAGMLWAMGKKGITVPTGFDMLLYGNIPNGAGLSSSSSVEVAVGEALRACYGLPLTNVEIALLGQRTENGFIGVNTGIMDQFVIAMGKEGQAVFLDTATLDYRYAPADLKGCSIIIINTLKKRGLADSKYNERRSECEHALKELKTVLPIQTLGDLTTKEFEKHQALITSPVERRRAKHAVTENQRTLQAFAALEKGDLAAFGKLMNESHASLRDDYEVSCRELDALVETAQSCPGVLGARMTGAGFGGCAIAIVRDEEAVNVQQKIAQAYLEKIGHPCAFYMASVGGGPREL